MAVYLLHFQAPLGHARHYIGFAHDISARFEHHKNGTGARILQVCNNRGITYIIARVWKYGDKTFERRLKNYKKPRRFCPLCSGEHANALMKGE